MPFIEQLAQQGGQGLLGAGMGLLLQGHNDRRQIRQQQALQNMQIAGQKQMMDYSYQQQLQMWKDTNYSAQVEQLKQAGLNPALLYGMKGGGGITTGSPGAPGVSGASAPTGGGEIPAMMQQGMNLELLKAQKDLLQAQAANLNADTMNKPKTGQLLETQVLDLKQGIENQKAQEELTRMETKLKRIEAYIKGETVDEAIDTAVQQLGKLNQEVMQLEVKTFIDRATQLTIVDKIRAELTGQLLANEMTKSNMAVNKAQINKWTEEIAQGWQALANQGVELEIEKGELKVKQTGAQTEQFKAAVQSRAVDVQKGMLDLQQKIHNVSDQTKLSVETVTKIITSILGAAQLK